MQQTTRRELFEAYKQAIIDYNESVDDIIVSADKETCELLCAMSSKSGEEESQGERR